MTRTANRGQAHRKVAPTEQMKEAREKFKRERVPAVKVPRVKLSPEAELIEARALWDYERARYRATIDRLEAEVNNLLGKVDGLMAELLAANRLIDEYAEAEGYVPDDGR